MKTLTFLFLFAILCTTGAKSQKTIKGSGYILTQQREVPVYNSIEVNGPLRIFATPDELRPVIIEADNNLFPYIKTEVRHDTLRMFIDREVYIETFAVMNIFLSIPNISNLKVENGANIDGSRTPWKNKVTTIKAYPNTRIKWYIDTPMLNLTAEGNTVEPTVPRNGIWVSSVSSSRFIEIRIARDAPSTIASGAWLLARCRRANSLKPL